MSTLNILDNLKIASPCPEDWASMSGDARTRHCDRCDRSVFNIAEMTREDAEALIRAAEGRTCVRLYQRTDGTVMTKDCGVAIAQRRRRMAWIGAAVAAAFSLVAGGVVAAQKRQCNTSNGGGTSIMSMQPFATLSAWFPNVFPQQHQVLMGDIAVLPPPQPVNPPSSPNNNGNGRP